MLANVDSGTATKATFGRFRSNRHPTNRKQLQRAATSRFIALCVMMLGIGSLWQSRSILSLVLSTSTQQESAIDAIRTDVVSNNIDTGTRYEKDPMQFAGSLQSGGSAGKTKDNTETPVTAAERERSVLALEPPPTKVTVEADDPSNAGNESETTFSLMQRIEHTPRNLTNIPKLRVVLWPDTQSGVRNSESFHLTENGINESAYLTLSNETWDFHSNVVWVGDMGMGGPRRQWCGAFGALAKQAKDKRRVSRLPLQWPICIVDYADGPSLPRCANIEAQVGVENVRYSVRSVVTGRNWNETIGWVQGGGRLSLNKTYGITYRQASYMVRTDMIKVLENSLRARNMTLADPIERIDRPVDVAHFWPHSNSSTNQQDRRSVLHFRSKLRSKISDLVVDLGKTQSSLNVFVGLKGHAKESGRTGVHTDYMNALLASKIVVVTQRDEWEEHYRLMEAIIGGAMVMTDRMLTLPAGLQNGTSIVEFDSAESLVSLISYYLRHSDERLEIARAARDVALRKHRSWHRMEEIIFGESLSNCSFQHPNSPCPYVAHGIDSKR